MQKQKFTIALTFILVPILALALAFLFEYLNAVTVFQNYISVWEDEVANEIMLSQQDALLNKILSQVKLMHSGIQIRGVEVGGKVLDFKMSGSCALEIKQSVSLNLLPVGTVTACISVPVLLQQSLLSPVFLLTLVFIIMGVEIYRRREKKLLIDLQISQSLAQLSRQVAHDIRAPMTALQAVLSAPHAMPEEYKSMLQKSVQRIQDIAQDLLKNSKTEMAKIQHRVNNDKSSAKSSHAGCEVTEAVEGLVEEFKVAHSNRDYVVQNTLNTKVHVAMVQATLQRVISNLLQNAIEATTENSQITLQLAQKDTRILISILDRGAGMSEEVLKQVGKAGITFKANGNGLGLSYAKSEVEKVGGQFQIFSKPDVGTQIHLQIPIAHQ